MEITVSIEWVSVLPADIEEGGVWEILFGVAMGVAVGQLDSVMNKHLG